jgi:geranylgeranyl diphosphate synthase, type II
MDILASTLNSETFENSGNSENSGDFNLSDYLATARAEVDAALDASIQVIYPEKIYESMRYSLLASGKRLRPILCLAACKLFGGDRSMSMPTACAMEMVHTMSLIHDDLPAMDNDDYRRGKLTNHKVYGEDIAVLAGDALLAYAFEFIAENTENVPAARILQVVSRLGHAVAAAGLVGGQVVDLESEGKSDVTLETLNFIHRHKTAELLEAAVVSGGILAGAGESDLAKLVTYAQNIGLAFQIIDDILDITSTPEELGKTVGKDVKAQKVTYPSLLGIPESQRQARDLIDVAKAQLECYGDAALPLLGIADYIIARNY